MPDSRLEERKTDRPSKMCPEYLLAEFQAKSKLMTRLARVRFNPTPPALSDTDVGVYQQDV